MSDAHEGTGARPAVLKTWKLFVGGALPRSESGRTYQPAAARHCNVARASRKDLRDAVEAARKGQGSWWNRDAYNRGQIVYRIAEMLETRATAIVDELVACGVEQEVARREVEASVDLCAWHAGLCDKVGVLLGSQNQVSGPFFNFSTIEPTGVVFVAAPEQPSLLGLLALLLPPLVGGNAVIALCSESAPLAGLAFGEVCASSDVPAGAINLLAGPRAELVGHAAAHRAIDGLLLAGRPEPSVGAEAADSVKRVRWCDAEWDAPGLAERVRRLDWVEPFVEVKTLWHPVSGW